MKTGIRHYGFILLLLVTLCCYGCTGNGTCDWDGLMELVQEEEGVSGEIHYGGTCGKARLGNDDAVVWYYTDNDSQNSEYIPAEVEQVGQVQYKFVRILETTEPAQGIAVARWQNGYTVFVNNPDCVTVEAAENKSRIWTDKNTNAIYPMVYYYDFEPVSLRFFDADGNEVK